MQKLRLLLWPFSVVYGFIMQVRNFLFDVNFLEAKSFKLPIIAVGNLSMGGTGKTPMIEYLITLLSDVSPIATLSRGYKRKTKGFVLANQDTNAAAIGDEPFQFFKKFKLIVVAVCENRVLGIQTLLKFETPPKVVLLDDAFQHRKVKAGLYLLLTSYDHLYCHDYVLPAGNLRESAKGANRAQVVVVTKCPESLTENEQATIKQQLKIKPTQQLFFSCISYADHYTNGIESLNFEAMQNKPKLIIVGIADGNLFINKVKAENDLVMSFKDHHHFTPQDIIAIKNKAQNRTIVTTEKDFMRLQLFDFDNKIFYLPIKVRFLNQQDEFNQLIKNYVRRYS